MTTRISQYRMLFTLCFCLLMAACSKIDQEHFTQVKPGMSLKEVTHILGNPTNSQTFDIIGLSGTSAVWKNEKVEIDIQFINDKVSVKSFSQLEKE